MLPFFPTEFLMLNEHAFTEKQQSFETASAPDKYPAIPYKPCRTMYFYCLACCKVNVVYT